MSMELKKGRGPRGRGRRPASLGDLAVTGGGGEGAAEEGRRDRGRQGTEEEG